MRSPDRPHPASVLRIFGGIAGALAAMSVCAAGAPALAQTFAEKYEDCLACHGKTGQSEIAEVPSLGGQPSLFVAIQLFLFRDGRRPGSPMTEFAKDITDEELRSYSEEIAKLPPPPPPDEGVDRGRYVRGAELSAKHRCNTCHNPDYSGRDQMPRLAGQREDYLLKSLREYKSGARIGSSAAMVEVLGPLSDADNQDIAHFLAQFR